MPLDGARLGRTFALSGKHEENPFSSEEQLAIDSFSLSCDSVSLRNLTSWQRSQSDRKGCPSGEQLAHAPGKGSLC